jgi:hypothetical protein
MTAMKILVSTLRFPLGFSSHSALSCLLMLDSRRSNEYTSPVDTAQTTNGGTKKPPKRRFLPTIQTQ